MNLPIRAHSKAGQLIYTEKFNIDQQAFGYCSVAEIENGSCKLTTQFTPNKMPLELFIFCSFDQSFVGKDVDLTYIIQSAPAGELVWSTLARLTIPFTDTLAWLTFADNPTEGQAPYPQELKNLAKGRYVWIASIVTPDGTHYSERTLPFVIR